MAVHHRLAFKLGSALLLAAILASSVSFLYFFSQMKSLLEEEIGWQMAVQAQITSHLIPLVENCTSPADINAALNKLAAEIETLGGEQHDLVYEFWITDSEGVAYLHSWSAEDYAKAGMTSDFDFTKPNQPQAADFRPLFWDSARREYGQHRSVVIQDIKKREVDEEHYKYAGVTGTDKSRIVQVGYQGDPLVRTIRGQSFVIVGSGAMLSLMISAILLTVVATRIVSRPIRLLTSEADSLVERGSYSPERLGAVSRRNDELGRLATVVAKLARGFVERETEYKQMVDQATRDKRIVLRINDEDRITYCNEIAEKVFGFERNDLCGKHVNAIVPPEAREEVKDVLSSVDSVEPSANLNENMTKDGRRLWIFWQNWVHERIDGGGRELLSVGADMTGLLRPDSTLPQRAGQMFRFTEKMMQARAVDYQRLQALAEEKAVADQANEFKEQLLAKVNHELNGPLYGIIEYARELQESVLSSSQRRTLRMLDTLAERMRTVVGDLLNFASIDRDGITLKTRPFALRQVYESTLDIWERKATDKGLGFHLNIGRDVPELFLGDDTRLQQVLSNLVSNAVNHTSTGEINVAVRVEAEESDAVCLLCEVTDTGPGVPDDARNEIFEPFKRLDDSPSRNRDGLGMGLAISRSIVMAMGGEIAVEDNPTGKGSRFWFTAKLRRASSPQEAPIRERLVGTASGLTALVVDNDELVRPATVRGFQRAGFDIIEAKSGDEAVGVLEGRSVDVVVMDVFMPGLDGCETTREIRQLEQRRDHLGRCTIIALTADKTQERRTLCMEAGMDGVFTKPPDWDEMLRFAVESTTGNRPVFGQLKGSHIDPTGIGAYFGNDPQEFQRFVDWLESDTAFSALEDAIDQAEWRSVADIAHSMAGRLNYFGKENGAVLLARELRDLAMAENGEGVAAGFAEFMRAVAELTTIVRELRLGDHE